MLTSLSFLYSFKKNGGGAKTAAEELAAKAGAVVPGKLPQGRLGLCSLYHINVIIK